MAPQLRPRTKPAENTEPADSVKIVELQKENENLKLRLDRSEKANGRLKRKASHSTEEIHNLQNVVGNSVQNEKLLEKRIRRTEDDLGEFKVLLVEKDKRIKEIGEESLELSEKERESCEVLKAQLLRAKQTIAAATRLDRQLSDETFQKSIGRMYTGILDCFQSIISKQEIDVRVKPEVGERLSHFVPDHEENTESDKLHTCVYAVSTALVLFVNREYVFGMGCTDPTWIATQLWYTIQNSRSRSPKLDKAKKQWLSLTSALFAATNQEDWDNAQKAALDAILDQACDELEALTTLEMTEALRKSLANAISPCVEVLRLIHYQEQPCTFKILPVTYGGQPMVLDPKTMEGAFGENQGIVKASIFPMLVRIENSDNDAGLGNWESICKARVAIHEDSERV